MKVSITNDNFIEDNLEMSFLQLLLDFLFSPFSHFLSTFYLSPLSLPLSLPLIFISLITCLYCFQWFFLLSAFCDPTVSSASYFSEDFPMKIAPVQWNNLLCHLKTTLTIAKIPIGKGDCENSTENLLSKSASNDGKNSGKFT